MSNIIRISSFGALLQFIIPYAQVFFFQRKAALYYERSVVLLFAVPLSLTIIPLITDHRFAIIVLPFTIYAV